MTSIHQAPDHSIWRITGTYPNGSGTFTDCVAVVLPAFTHGTDETLLEILPPIGSLITSTQVTTAQLVLEDPWSDLGHPVEAVA